MVWAPDYLAFAEAGIPEIQDLNVLDDFRLPFAEGRKGGPDRVIWTVRPSQTSRYEAGRESSTVN